MHLPTWGVPLSVSYHFVFSSCSWGSQGKNAEVVCRSLLQWTTFCPTSPPWPVRLGWHHMAWLSFIELDKAVVHVIRLATYLWLWFLSVCLLMPSLSTYHLAWVSITLDVGYLFMAAPAKRSCCSFDLGKLLSAAPAPSVVDVKCLPQDVQYYSGVSQYLFRKTRTGRPVFDNT